MMSIAAFPLLLKEKSVEVKFEDLPENLIGYLQSSQLTINSYFKSDISLRYYIALLLEEREAGYDCILELRGSDTVRRYIK